MCAAFKCTPTGTIIYGEVQLLSSIYISRFLHTFLEIIISSCILQCVLSLEQIRISVGDFFVVSSIVLVVIIIVSNSLVDVINNTIEYLLFLLLPACMFR